MAPPSPRPDTAAYLPFSPFVTVGFDLPLTADPALDVINWWIRLANKRQNITGVSASGFAVTVLRNDGPVDVGADVVSYRPPPFDLLGVDRTAAFGFEDFPITIVPPKGGR